MTYKGYEIQAQYKLWVLFGLDHHGNPVAQTDRESTDRYCDDVWYVVIKDGRIVADEGMNDIEDAKRWIDERPVNKQPAGAL